MRVFAVAAGALILASCGGRPEEMNVTTQTMAGTSIPPVDREVPAKLETATFAVG